MCAIMGFTSKTMTEEQIRPFFEKTVSRGPDMSRMEETEGGWLCFHRLAIMGLDESGMQPFQRDGDMVVCNGELYGWRALKKELQAKGYTFQSGSDCELLLPMYREYGLDMFAKLDAEYALILYDGKTGETIAARDPIGIRPLFYGYLDAAVLQISAPCFTDIWRTAASSSPARPRTWWACAKRYAPSRLATTTPGANLSATPT